MSQNPSAEANGHLPPPFTPGPDVDSLDPAAFASLGSFDDAVRPRTPETCARTLSAVREAGLCLLVHGSGSQLHSGHPTPTDIVLDTRGLNRIVAVEPADMTITVQAGASLGEIQARLAEHGQFLPLDPALPEHATIGGLIATNAAGPLRLGFGTVRDYLLGVQLARPDGELTRAGGRVVKNVAGYELCKLYTGSWGTLGVIVEATFKVRPIPRAWRALQLAFAALADAEAAVAALLDSDVEPLAAELLPLRTATHVGLPQTAPYALYVLFGGEATTVEWQLQRATDLLCSLGTVQALEDAHESVHPALIAAHRPSDLALRAGLLSSETSRFCAEAEALCAGSHVALRWAAHAGSGVVTLHLETRDRAVLPALCERLLQRAVQPATAATQPDQSGSVRRAARLAPTPAEREQAVGFGGGNLVVVHAPDALRRQIAPWGRVPAAADLMRALKTCFDPQGVLNPGRFVDGI